MTEENLSEYTLFDIILPLPGYSVQYPENDTKKYYDEILSELNLTDECWENKSKLVIIIDSAKKF